MKIYNENGVHIKTIPAKFETCAVGFKFTSKKKRLQPKERFDLTVLLIKEYFKPFVKKGCMQDQFAAIAVSKTKKLEIICVNRREYSEYRIITDYLEINIPSVLVAGCPEEFIGNKNQF
jgi:hypothetical protein